MSGGFPRRPSLDSFGPQLQDTRVIRNPGAEAGSDLLNLMRFQLAGAGLMVARAWAVIDGTGGVITLAAHAESWNPKGLTAAPYTPPVAVRTSTGLYTLTYQATYPDDAGALVGLGISETWSRPLRSANVRDAATTFTGNVITVNLKEFQAGSYVAVDGRVLVALL